jgi:predicted nucleic acid-binding protein
LIAYVDTSIFIDYFVGRRDDAAILRETPRRQRLPAQLSNDADQCLRKLTAPHSIITSALTFYEVEEAMLRALAKAGSALTGRRPADKFLVPAARVVLEQMFATSEVFGIKVVDLTLTTVSAQRLNHELTVSGIRSADALHISSALLHDADVMITGDKRLVSLDSRLRTTSGNALRILDTDAALNYIA